MSSAAMALHLAIPCRVFIDLLRLLLSRAVPPFTKKHM